jgi:hypothetical protein
VLIVFLIGLILCVAGHLSGVGRGPYPW